MYRTNSDVTARCSDAIYSRATPRPVACSRYFTLRGNKALISYTEVTVLYDMLDAQLFLRPRRVPRRKPDRKAGHLYGHYTVYRDKYFCSVCGRSRFALSATHIPSGFAAQRDGPPETVNNTKTAF